MKTFLLGCGAQKAGTSWIQSYLAAQPGADFGPLKEYHTFNALHLPDYAHVAERRDPSLLQPRKFASHIVRHRRLPGDERLRKRLRAGRNYHAFFAKRLAQPDVRLTGDMTPDYAALPASIIKAVRARFIQNDIAVKALFMMRDPVDRCVSAVRMYRGRSPKDHRLPVSAEQTTTAALLVLYATRRFEALTRYDITLSHLADTFDEDEIFVGLYEDLFNRETVGAITRFCGLAADRPDFSKRVHESPFKDEAVTEAAKAAVARHYRPVYHMAAKRFGAARMKALWGGYQYL
ncbi:MAG: hypothetical protein AAGD34_02830 [Pseudomonadota bacterium]